MELPEEIGTVKSSERSEKGITVNIILNSWFIARLKNGKDVTFHRHTFRELPYSIRLRRATYACDCGYIKTLGYDGYALRMFRAANKRGQVGLVRTGNNG